MDPLLVIKMDDCKLIVNILKITFELKNDLEIRMCRFDNILGQFIKFISYFDWDFCEEVTR